MRILICGLGSIGQRHLKNLLELGVQDISLLRSSPRTIPEAPFLPVFTDLNEGLATKPDVVLISNPTAFHVATACKAIEAGCQVFIEKPLSHSLDEVEKLETLVQKKNPLVVMGFDMRFDPGLNKVKELLEEGIIGRVVSIQAQVGQFLPDWHPQEDYRKGVSARRETGGGVILDLIHELDYVMWLIGPVSEVTCFADRVSTLEIETEDVAAIVLKFQCGAIGTVHLDYIQRSASRSCRIIGEEGTILWDYFGQRVSWYKAGKDSWEEWEYPQHVRNDRFREEMRHLVACVNGTEAPRTDFSVGKTTLELALAAKKSAEKRSVCTI